MADAGKLYAYVGTMGAGKSKKLCSLYKRLTEEGKNVIVFKHSNDVDRGGHESMVVSRNGDTAPAIAVDSLAEILFHETDEKFDAILIDEIQFFDDEFTLDIIEGATLVGIDVLVFGLDVSSDFTSFGLMGEILSRADEVKKLKCKCSMCGSAARVSAYVGDSAKDGQVRVGDIGDYYPVCRNCYYTRIKEDVEDVEDEGADAFYEFVIKVEGHVLEMGTYASVLKRAGYTYEDVEDINTVAGARNLIKDLGIE